MGRLKFNIFFKKKRKDKDPSIRTLDEKMFDMIKNLPLDMWVPQYLPGDIKPSTYEAAIDGIEIDLSHHGSVCVHDPALTNMQFATSKRRYHHLEVERKDVDKLYNEILCKISNPAANARKEEIIKQVIGEDNGTDDNRIE